MIHNTALVDKGAQIGENTAIWHWAHICNGAKIGKNCTIGQNVYIGNEVEIGDNVKIQNNVSIYDKIILENNVFCGPSVVFTNVYNPRSKYPKKKEYKSTYIKEGVSLGANSTIICGITIEHDAFVGAGSLVNKDVEPFSLIVGNPARQIGWMSTYGERINLPLFGDGIWICEKTNSKYILEKNKLIRKDIL